MEGSESALNRVGRAMWTVWGYLTGTVGRYLRPEVTNEEAHNVHFKQEDTVTISKGHKELKVKEEEKERTETKTSERKTREDLQYPGVRVQAAAVQWEKGNIAHEGHEVKVKSKHTCASSEDIDKKLQTKKDNEKTLDNKNGSRKTYGSQFTELQDSPAYIDADVKNQDRTFSGSEEADLNFERSETNQEQTKKPEEEEKIIRREFDETQEEPIKSEFIDQGLLAKEADLNVERNENSQEQRRKFKEEEEGVDEIMRREIDESGEEPIKSKFTERGLLAKEADLNVERNENSQEQRRKQEEEGVDEFLRREYDETREEPIKSEFIDQGLLAKEADLNVERSENSQEQKRKQEEEGVDEIMRREIDESGEEPIKSKFTERGLLAKEADLNVERNENSQEQRRKSEEEEESVDEISRTEYDETEEEPIKSELIEQGLLAKEADLHVERNKNDQEQRGKLEEEGVDEISRREYDESEEEPIKSEFIDQGLLAKEADLNVERNENSQEQRRKFKEEGVDEIMRREYDATQEEPIKSEFIDQGLLAKEADLNVERSENSQEQKRKQEEEGVDEIMRREIDESGEEPIKSKFTERGLLAKEADLNVERNENSQEQRRKSEEEEESVDEISRTEYDETEEEPIKSELIEQGLLAKEADLHVERNKNDQEQRGKLEEEGVDEISRREYDESEEEPIKSEIIDQGLDPEEQASACDMGDTAVVHAASVEKIMECVYDQDKNELNVAEQSNQGMTEHENEVNKSQIVDESLFIQLASTREGRDPLNDGLKLEVEMTENATLLQDKEVIEVDNEETKQETVGKVKDGYHEEFSAWEQFTGTDIAEEQKVCDTDMKETLKLIVIDRHVETECELLETAQIENAEIYKKEPEPSRMFEDEDNNLAVTIKLQQLEPSKEQKSISEVALNVDLRQLDDKAHDHNGSQRPAVVTKQYVEGVITQPQTGTGNQIETVETRSKFTAEVAAVDVKKSAERETSSREQPINKEEVAVQEIMGQCFLEQGSLLEESTNKRINELSLLEAPFIEMKSVPLEQVDETAVESVDEMQGSSLQELEECSSEAELKVKAKSSSPEQTAEVFETLSEVTGMSRGELKCEQAQPECEISLVENTCDKSILDETPLEEQINQDECTVQDSAAEVSSHRLQTELTEALYLPERESEQETLEMQRDSQKDTEEQERTDDAETGLLDEIKDVASCLGVVEEITSGLPRESEDSEWELLREMEAPERKKHKSDLENHEETSESNMNVELRNDTWECEKELVAEMTDIESMVVSTGREMELVKKIKEPVTEEEKDKCHLVFSESEASKEIIKEPEAKIEHESEVDSKEDVEERGRPGLKRGFEKMARDNDKDRPSVLTDLLLPSQASSLDFTVQKSKIAVKNPLIRPPKDPRTLINMASVEPLTPPHPSQPSFLKKSQLESASVPSKGVTGFKLPGLGVGFPALRKTEVGRKIRDGEVTHSESSQKSDSGSQPADDNVKQETLPHKPKWTPPRQPGMGSPMMMAELKNKLKKPVKE